MIRSAWPVGPSLISNRGGAVDVENDSSHGGRRLVQCHPHPLDRPQVDLGRVRDLGNDVRKVDEQSVRRVADGVQPAREGGGWR